MSRRPLLVLALAVLGGVFVAPWLQPAPGPTLAAALAGALLSLVRERSGRIGLPAVGFLLGMALPPSIPEGPPLEGRVRVLGEVASGSSGRSTLLEIRATAEGTGPWRPSQGRLRAVFPQRAPTVGAQVVARGSSLFEPKAILPGEPDPAREAWLLRSPSLLLVEDWSPTGGETAPSDSFSSSRHAGVLRALALGDMTGIDSATNALYRATGTSHLLSIGGLHISLIAGPAALLVMALARCTALLRPRSRARWWGALGGAAAALFYGQVAGWPVSAVRSVVMGVLGLGLLAMERHRDAWNLLGGAALVLTLWDPGGIVSPSWQLSFGALVGLLIVSPRILRLVPPDLPRPVTWLVGALTTSVAATVGTLPACAWHFQRLPPLSPLANLLAVPIVGAVTTPTAHLGAFLPGVPGRMAIRIADLSLDGVEAWLRWLPSPMAYPAVGPAGALLLLAAVLLVRRPAIAGLLALAALGLREVPTRDLVVTFLSVGDGDAILVEWPDGRRWLVDAGPEEDQVASWLRRRGVRRLDTVILTHPHPDHVGGMVRVLETLTVRQMWMSPPEGDSPVLDAANMRNIRVRFPGHPAVRVVWPPPEGEGEVNERSLVLDLHNGNHRFLLTGDIGSETEALLPVDGPVDVLKIAHHGSRYSSSEAFLDRIRPGMAVISTGGGQGHPHPSVLGRLRGIPTLRTDRDGTLEIRSDGTTLSIRAWRPGRGWTPLSRSPPRSYASGLEASLSSSTGALSLLSSMNR